MQRYPITPEGQERLRAELRRMIEVDRPEVVLAIETARAHGDLSENAEYDYAKDKQGMIEAKIRDLEAKLSMAEVIDPKTMSGDKVMFGATVTMEDLDTDEELTYKLQNLEALYVTYARRYDLHAASIAILNLRRLPVRVVARLFSDRPSHSLHLRSNTSRELKSTGKPLSCRYSHLHSWRRRTRFLQLCRTRSRPLPTA